MFLAGPLFDIGMAKLANEAQAAVIGGEESDPIIRQHVFVGRELAHAVQGTPRQVHDAALRHYEIWDGSGYPSGLTGAEIPRATRTAAVVGVFDGLTTDRPGVARMSSFDALSHMQRGMRRRFDPAVVEALIVGLSGEAGFTQYGGDGCGEARAGRGGLTDLMYRPLPQCWLKYRDDVGARRVDGWT